MKMRKLFAGIAAAATMLGGLALGATTASAAEVNSISTISLYNASPDATYTAYRIAGYADPEYDATDTAKVTGISITKLNDTVNTAVQEAALAAWNAQNNTELTTVPQPYQDNAAAWVATWKTDENAAELRKFAENLATKTDQLGEGEELDTEHATRVTSGWYLVVSPESKPLLVGTGFYHKLDDGSTR